MPFLGEGETNLEHIECLSKHMTLKRTVFYINHRVIDQLFISLDAGSHLFVLRREGKTIFILFQSHLCSYIKYPYHNMQVINTRPFYIRSIRDYTIIRLHFTAQTNMIERTYTHMIERTCTTCIKIHVIAVNLYRRNCLKTNVEDVGFQKEHNRYENMAEEDRKGPFCKTVIEYEAHVMFDCPTDFRPGLLLKASGVYNDFMICKLDQLKVLFNHPSLIRICAKTCFNIFKRRTQLLCK